jgi:hypothetical protein
MLRLMKRSYLFSSLVGGLFVLGSQLAACSDDEPSERSRAQFCQDWADAACSDDTVSACQASDASACRNAQQTYCEALVPAAFSDDRGDACIDAVRAAYADADLTGAEIAVVRRLGGECSGIVTGTQAVGQTCDTNGDCDGSKGVECVKRGGLPGGTCQVPELVGPGQACSDPAQTCSDGFFCDGSNCIAARATGQACQNDVECSPNGYCSAGDVCVARGAVNSVCTSDDECLSEVCYAANGERTCSDLIRLSLSEDICDDLR